MKSAFLQLHLSIFIAGFTGVLGRLIQLPEGPLVLYRMLLTLVMIGGWLLVSGKLPRLKARDMFRISIVGALIAVHWLFFYGSIKYSNVSIAVVCFALVGFFTAIVEPLADRRIISLREIGFSVITVLGVGLIFHFDTRYRVGIILGVLAALFGAFFTVAMRRVGKDYDPTTMLVYQTGGGAAFLLLVSPLYMALFPNANFTPTAMDLFWLILLSSICTIGLFRLQLLALRSISAFTVSLSYNLEPLYSIALAFVIFNEAQEMSFAFFAGLFCICLSVILQSIYVVRQRGGVR